MAELHGRRPSEWRRLFLIATDLIDRLQKKRRRSGLSMVVWRWHGHDDPDWSS
jgi:hypothetical protein